jgi:hypothetical protein
MNHPVLFGIAVIITMVMIYYMWQAHVTPTNAAKDLLMAGEAASILAAYCSLVLFWMVK